MKESHKTFNLEINQKSQILISRLILIRLFSLTKKLSSSNPISSLEIDNKIFFISHFTSAKVPFIAAHKA